MCHIITLSPLDPSSKDNGIARTFISNRPFVMIDCEFLTEKSYDFLLNSDKSPLNEFNVTVYFQNFAAINTKRLSELLSTITETGLIRRLRLIFSCTCHEVGELPLCWKFLIL